MLFKNYIYGPVNSRRFGMSLGINLISPSSKICSFNCIYCECGFNSEKYIKDFVNKHDVIEFLEYALKSFKEKSQHLDVITFAGNGEPTLHPDFLEISIKVKEVKNLYYPYTKIVLLTNGTQIFNDDVIKSLENIDIPVFKLDSAIEKTAKFINQFDDKYNYQLYLKKLVSLSGKIYIQTMFLRGEYNNTFIDNTTRDEIDALVQIYRKINPILIYLYSIDRPPPVSTLKKITNEEMSKIAQYISQNNLPVNWVS